ncbi:MAG: enoyl-CoA hydratase/isomerase family protein [SAR324 cluster bacterium]|nr:enoyl-CoA hydratase/isomerase family protein [SAR324 cluster bacterium]
MSYTDFKCLRVRLDRGVAFVTIDHPPINLLDRELMLEFHYLGKQLEQDNAVKVAVFESANPEFFIAHADVTGIQALAAQPPLETERPNFIQAMTDRFRTMPKATIAKIEGFARGGGSELALAMDMRFAAKGRAVLSQPEVALGIIPGGGGTQRLPRLVGRSRAMEIVLGCEDFTAELAERYGWVNRALPPEELGPFVERLARRIASFPAEAIAQAKAAVNQAYAATRAELTGENQAFDKALRAPEALVFMQRFMDRGGQTREGEMKIDPFAALAEE